MKLSAEYFNDVPKKNGGFVCFRESGLFVLFVCFLSLFFLPHFQDDFLTYFFSILFVFRSKDNLAYILNVLTS